LPSSVQHNGPRLDWGPVIIRIDLWISRQERHREQTSDGVHIRMSSGGRLEYSAHPAAAKRPEGITVGYPRCISSSKPAIPIPARQQNVRGCPVASTTLIHKSPWGSTVLRCRIVRRMRTCTNRPCHRPVNISVRPTWPRGPVDSRCS
jgi:hypothetical protein